MSTVSNPYTFNIKSNTSFNITSNISPVLETTKLIITSGNSSTEHFEWYGYSVNFGKLSPNYIIYNGISYEIQFLYIEIYDDRTYLAFENKSHPFSSITLECNGVTRKLEYSSFLQYYIGGKLLPTSEGTYTINIISVTV